MANTLLTIGGIVSKCLQIFKNSNAFLQNVSRHYDDSFAKSGAKIGATLRVRQTNDPIPAFGAVVTPQTSVEQAITITVAKQANVTLSFSASELALSMDDFADRFLVSATNNLAGLVAGDLMSVVEGVPNVVGNYNAGTLVSPTAATWLQAGAILDNYSCPRGNRTAILSPATSARTVTSMLGLFNPTNQISKQFEAGTMGASRGTLGIDDWRMDQTVINHATAAYGALGTFTSVSANGLVLTTSALAGPLNAGDIIQIANLNSVNRVTKLSTMIPMTFVVTSAVLSGATTVPIYPALIPPVGGNAVSFQTVDSVPVGGAAITSPVVASSIYRANIVYDPLAFTLITADLEMPTSGVVRAGRKNYDGISLRMITDWITLTDQEVTRMDVLYGYSVIRPEWCVKVLDVI